MRFYLTPHTNILNGEIVPVYWVFPLAVPSSYYNANGLHAVTATAVPNKSITHNFGMMFTEWPGDTSMLPIPQHEDDGYDDDGPEPGELVPYFSSPSPSPSSEGQGAENPQHDFPQKYLETFVLARVVKDGEWGAPEVVFIQGMKPQEHPGRWGDIIWSNTKEKKVTPYIGFEVLNGIPSNKLINTTSNFIAEYSRTPDRQWKRGVCESTFVVAVPSVWERDQMVRATKGTSYTIKSNSEKAWVSLVIPMGPFGMLNMMELFKPTYPSYAEAVKRILAGQSYSVAFTERAYVSCSPRTPNLVFGIGTLPVGEINPDIPDTIVIKEKLLQQELLDVVKRNNLQLKVI